jgi:hypothetical protein
VRWQCLSKTQLNGPCRWMLTDLNLSTSLGSPIRDLSVGKPSVYARCYFSTGLVNSSALDRVHAVRERAAAQAS